MGTLETLTPLLGLAAGLIIARFTKEELKHEQYFMIINNALSTIILSVILYQNITLAALLAVSATVFSVQCLTRVKHNVMIAPLLAVIAALSPLALIPVFLYSISLASTNKEKETIYSAAGYLAVATLSTL